MITRDAVETSDPTSGLTSVDGEPYCRIAAYDRMPPFLMSIASDTDLWMFVASGGGLTAGRVDADGALFPYETVDKLHDGHHHTGPVTLFRIRRGTGPHVLWQPFREDSVENGHIERNLYKNTLGNRVVFEEVRHDLGLTFRYRWSACDELGLVRTATLLNRGTGDVTISLLDGLRNVLPYGAPVALYQRVSSLTEAYRRTDCDPDTHLGIFSLTSRILDRAEAAEVLRANTVWCHGLPGRRVCLSIDAVSAFRRMERVEGETTLTGRRGNYLVLSSLELAPGAESRWHLVADVARSHVQVAELRARLSSKGDIDGDIEDRLRDASENLLRNVASADGLQLTGHAEASVHHFANVLFNNMRGGVFARNYDVRRTDFADFLETRNREVAGRHRVFVDGLPERTPAPELLSAAEDTGDADLQRLTHEYLPLWFGRRHGDPSRPWNRFSIDVHNGDGSRSLHYQGNWRDIFQNWEALLQSFPRFLPGIIAKFVNASTVDGFNPYRITREGIDWEVEDPDDPWSYIGYWGDHQIIYLLKLLEALRRFSPGALGHLLDREIFCYAHVPYRLKPYDEIVRDPHATIRFDRGLDGRVEQRVHAVGTDGKLLPGPDGAIYHVNLLEKLLVPALSKLSNLVPDGGIWMNTQRPEWNDANNALVGNGVSVVTLCYLRRYLSFLGDLLDARSEAASVSTEVAAWLRRVASVLDDPRLTAGPDRLDDRDRRELLDALGEAFSDYRAEVYRSGFSGKTELPIPEISGFCRRALKVIDRTVRINRRDDGLYHAYNLMAVDVGGGRASVRPLYEMLEGQVAALSSGVVDAEEAVALVSRLFESRLYRPDQRSFLLYPERELPAFLRKNVIPDRSVRAVPFLRSLVEAGEPSVLARDADGVFRFHADFQNADDLAAALDRLAEQDEWTEGVAEDRQAVLDVFEEVFDHRSFTGRSGTMYGYEGLGCIYWHMVAKLLLAVQEIVLQTPNEGEHAPVRRALIRHYYRIRSGLGFEKTAEEYGAFPTDPYSHTPRHAGARQPGMTGQVKEEILTRFGELGVRVENGTVRFHPTLLRQAELLREPAEYRYHDVEGTRRVRKLPARSLAFTLCQVPVVYRLTDEADPWIHVQKGDGECPRRAGDRLDTELSRELFDRSGRIREIEVGVSKDSLLHG